MSAYIEPDPAVTFAVVLTTGQLRSLTRHVEEMDEQERDNLAIAADEYLIEVARVRAVEAELSRADLLNIAPAAPYERSTHLRLFPGLPLHRAVPCDCEMNSDHFDLTRKHLEA